MRSTFKVLFYLKKNAPKKNGSVPVMFYINEHKHEQIIGTSTKTVGIDTLDGIFMPSSSIPTEWSFPPKRRYENITLTLSLIHI